MSETTKSLGDTPADNAEGGVVANSPEATFPEKKSGHKSSHFRGVTLFRPTMKWRAQVLYQLQNSSWFCRRQRVLESCQMADNYAYLASHRFFDTSSKNMARDWLELPLPGPEPASCFMYS